MRSVRPPGQQIVRGLGTSLKPQNRSLAGSAVQRFNLDASALQSPEQVSRALQLLTGSLADVGATANGNPFASSVLIRDVSTTSGTPLLISHLLGRMVNGWLAARPRKASWSGYELGLGDTQFDATVDRTKQIQILPGATGVFDFLFY